MRPDTTEDPNQPVNNPAQPLRQKSFRSSVTFTRPSTETSMETGAAQVEAGADSEPEDTSQSVFEEPWVARLIGTFSWRDYWGLAPTLVSKTR